MPDNAWREEPPRESRGFNINFHPYLDGWLVELTPNPHSVSEAFRPRWIAQFQVEGFAPGAQFTTGQCLSLLAIYLEDIAAERVEASGFRR